jgi:phage tail protein X
LFKELVAALCVRMYTHLTAATCTRAHNSDRHGLAFTLSPRFKLSH